MRLTASCAVLAVLATGCSFVGVRGPSNRVGLVPEDPDDLTCTESTLLPSLDALGGALAISVAGGGIIIEQTSDEGDLEDFTKLYAGPLVALGILYFVSASWGNNRITWCTDARERSIKARDAIRPVELPEPTRTRPEELDIEIHDPPATDPEEPDIEIHE